MTAIVLASASPRRRDLLAALGLPFRVLVSDTGEEPAPGLDPTAQAITLAERKARAIAAELDNALVLGADTIVVLDNEILGKPADDVDATNMLRRLQNREHRVITGVALVDATSSASCNAVVTSAVRMRPLTDHEIAAYVATGEPLDKAGAYAIQGLGSNLIEAFGGCYTNIVGLPLCAVTNLLIAAGVSVSLANPVCRLPDGHTCPRIV